MTPVELALEAWFANTSRGWEAAMSAALAAAQVKDLTYEEALTMVKGRINQLGTQERFAKEAGISPSFINGVLNGKTKISDRVARAAGFKRVVVYRKL